MFSKVSCPKHAYLEGLIVTKNIEEIKKFLKENKEYLDFNVVVEIPDIIEGSLILCILKVPEIAAVFIEEIGLKEMIGNIDVERLFVNCPDSPELGILWHLVSQKGWNSIVLHRPELLTPENVSMGPVEGLNKGKTVLWFLAACPELHALLLQRPELLTPENVSMGPVEGPDKGKTVLLCLGATPTLRPLLHRRPELLTPENVSMGLGEGPDKGKTILFCFAATPTLHPLLFQRPELLTPESISKGPAEGPDKGNTVVWGLAAIPTLHPLLLQRPELLTPENVSSGLVEGPHKGKTVLWFLASNSALHPLLLQRPELLTPENVSIGPAEGPNKGITVLWFLSTIPTLRPLLLQRPELLTPENVSSGPVEGPNKGKTVGQTVLWFLAGGPTLHPLLLQRPEFLTPENVSSGPVEGPDKGKTVLWFLASNSALRPLLHQRPELLTPENVSSGPVEGPNKGKTVLWFLASNSALHPLLLQKPELLTGRWLGEEGLVDSIPSLLKKEVATQMLVQVYESTLSVLRTENWTAMATLLQQNPWLARIRTDAQQNTLLHSLVNTVNQYNKNRVLYFLHHQKSMLKLLRKEASLLENAEEETADLLAGTIALRDVVRAPVSPYQAKLEHLLLDDEENFRFISEVLCHRYALGGVVLKIADPEKKEVQIATTLELVSYLGEQINLAGSFTDLLTPNALLQIKALINKCNAYNMCMLTQQEGLKLLTKADRFHLSSFCSQLAYINHEASPHNQEALHPGKRKQAKHPEEMRQAKRVKTTTHCFFAEEHHEPVESTVNVEAHATL